MKHIQKYALIVILAAGMISCNKGEIDVATENGLVFNIMTKSMNEETRGQRYNSETEFSAQTFGLYGWNTSNGDKVVCTNTSVSKIGGDWKPANTLKLNKKCNYVFEAVYPKPASPLGTVGLTALSVNKEPGSLTFSYKIPTNTMTAEDKDLMFAYYRGSSTDGKVPLTFTHPLTCVNFKCGSMGGIRTINYITLNGVYESGNCTVRTAPEGCYSYEVSSSNQTSLWTPAGKTSVTGTSIIKASTIATNSWAYNFFLIPQNTAVQEVTMTINVTDFNNETYSLETTVNTGYWRAGYTNTYEIMYNVGIGINVTLVSEDYTGGSWSTHGTGNTTAGQFHGENW